MNYSDIHDEIFFEATFKKILSCDRVSQMTKTYNDIEAVTRLLKEKESDLELAAEIGNQLLQKNNALTTKLSQFETELKAANEKNAQLSYDLTKKTELITLLTNDIDDNSYYDAASNVPPSLSTLHAVELKQRQIDKLIAENQSLHLKYSKLIADTNECEEKEKSLVSDFKLQLVTANMDINTLDDDLKRYQEENKQQHEEIFALKAKIDDLEMRLRILTEENRNYKDLVDITKETQDSLTTELAEVKQKLNETVSLYKEADEQLKRQKRIRSKLDSFGVESLHKSTSLQTYVSELSKISESGLLCDDFGAGCSSTIKKSNFKEVFNTVQSASKSSTSGCDTGSEFSSLYSEMNNGLNSITIDDSLTTSDSAVENLGAKQEMAVAVTVMMTTATITATTMTTTTSAVDLENVLRNLSVTDVMRRRDRLQDNNVASLTNSCQYSVRAVTGDSIMSTGLSKSSSRVDITNPKWRYSHKLEIVKPIEGSQLLNKWNYIAQPSLFGLLEGKVGYSTRGDRSFEDLLINNSTADYEEDVEYENPGKRYDNSNCVYTLTNSTVMHPDDKSIGSSVISSIQHSRISSACTSAVPSPPSLSPQRSRRNSTCTYSTNFGLAKSLNERDLYSWNPASSSNQMSANLLDDNVSATSTPCNSPYGSRSSSPEPQSPIPFELPHSSFGFSELLSSGANLLKWTFGSAAIAPTPQQDESRYYYQSISDLDVMSLERMSRKYVCGGTGTGVSSNRSSSASSICSVSGDDRIGLESIIPYNPMSSPNLAKKRALQYYNNNAVATSVASTATNAATTAVEAKKHMSGEESLEKFPEFRLGVPGKPGSSALSNRIKMLNRSRRERFMHANSRSDLGNPDQSSASAAEAAVAIAKHAAETLLNIENLQSHTVLKTASPTEPLAPQQQQWFASSTLESLGNFLFGRKGGYV